MKKIGMFLLALTLGLNLVGCGKDDAKEQVKEEINVTAAELTTTMIEGEETPNLIDADEVMLKDTYKIDPTILDSYSIKKPAIAQAVYEVAVFKVKSDDDVVTVTNALEGYKENLMGPGAMYPSVHDAAEKSEIINNGKYVAFIMVHPDQVASLDSLKEKFNTATK